VVLLGLSGLKKKQVFFWVNFITSTLIAHRLGNGCTHYESLPRCFNKGPHQFATKCRIL